MPRSSRHRSSKHSSSRDARDYSDLEKDSGLKDRKGKEMKESSGGRASKDLVTGEKRKLDSKDNKESFGPGNGEYVEEYLSSLKRRKERVNDGVVGRWYGGEDDREEGTKKSKERSSESKSRRREESVGVYVEIDDVVVKKSSGRSEGKHRELGSGKEGKERGAERERDGERQGDKVREKERERERKGRDRDGKGQRYADIDDLRAAKHVVGKAGLSTYSLQSPGSENQSERQMRRKRDGSGDGERHQDDFVDIGDIYSIDDVSKDERLSDEKHRVGRHRDKYREDVDKESGYHDRKQKDEHFARDHTNTRSDDKHVRDEKDTTEMRQKKSKPVDLDHDEKQDRDRDHDHEHYWNREHVRERSCDRDHERDHRRSHVRERGCGLEWDRDQDRDHGHDCDWVQDGDRDHDHDREWDRDRGQERGCVQNCDRDRYHDGNLDYDVANIDDQSAKHKDSRGKKRSPNDNNEYSDGKSRVVKPFCPDMENTSLSSSSRVEPGSERRRSQPHQPLLDNNVSPSRHRISPITSLADEDRNIKAEELKYRNDVTEQTTQTISSRRVTGVAGASERVSKYRSTEIPTSFDDVLVVEPSVEISSSSKASPMALVDRSPSSSSLVRRYMNRTGGRRSIDIEESGRRSSDSKGARDLPPAEDRPTRDLPVDKRPVDELVVADSSCYNRSGQRNSASFPPTGNRGGVGSPFMGALEANGRMNTGSRYKRTCDPNFARGQGNAWRGAPNWSSSMPNGYMPFQNGPHGSFQTIVPQFQSSLFAVRPSMDVNPSGIAYHISDADRFPNHLHPVGWENVMNGLGLSHVHGWDGNNVVYREEMHIYGGPDWEQNGHPLNGRGWETSGDMWKGNGDGKVDLPSASLKETAVVQPPVGDVSAGQGGEMSKMESAHDGVQAEGIDKKTAVTSSAKEYSKFLHNSANEKTPDSKMSDDDNVASFYCAYLSKLDISTELVSPVLYSQCMSLLNIGQSTTVDEDTSMLVRLKDCARAVSKTSNTFSLLFPATSDSTYQRAMDTYKKQRLGFSGFQTISGGTKDDNLASKAEKQVGICDMDEVKEPAVNCDVEMADAPVQNFVEKKKKAVITATGQKSDDFLLLCVREGLVRACSPIVKLEESAQALSPDSPEKSLHGVSIDKVDGIPSELSSAEEIQENCVLISGNVSQASASVAADCHKIDEIGKIEDPNSFYCAGEGQLLDDAMCGSLLFSDGPVKASEALMPESNESKLVILSRIHHSPENTH